MELTQNMNRYLTQQDAALLSRLAENLLRELDVKFNRGERLVDILTSAILLPENVRRDDCVSLYSKVLYLRLDTNECHTATIVFPYEASPALAHVSALAPLSLALIGREINSIAEVELHDEHSYGIRIVAINNISRTVVESPPEQIAPLI
ncbi:GreA/GreB family elongation factor [Oxalobacteraceae bacterium R-40]|uniref:GreA/GreB family elongation factor n=1 Tax=Keguizhuia sedimenti TaxID=3064264 RepID=A0ABU1BTQ4_9BURK|nr:GreA/GreB family elongation factor [Oxalobacteraceae bacterium R-40]